MGVGLLGERLLVDLAVLDLTIGADLFEFKVAGHAIAGMLLKIVDTGDLADLTPGILDIVIALEEHLIGDVGKDARQRERAKCRLKPSGRVAAKARECSAADPLAELLDADAAHLIGGGEGLVIVHGLQPFCRHAATDHGDRFKNFRSARRCSCTAGALGREARRTSSSVRSLSQPSSIAFA